MERLMLSKDELKIGMMLYTEAVGKLVGWRAKELDKGPRFLSDHLPQSIKNRIFRDFTANK